MSIERNRICFVDKHVRGDSLRDRFRLRPARFARVLAGRSARRFLYVEIARVSVRRYPFSLFRKKKKKYDPERTDLGKADAVL